MKIIGTIVVTALASIVVVPVVFGLTALAQWNIVLPEIITFCENDCYYVETFVSCMLAPFRDSIKSVRFIYRNIDDTMNGRETV